MNSSVMIAPAGNTPPSAARYLKAKYNMIEKGILKSSPQAQKKLCQLRQHKPGTCDYCSARKEKILEDAMSTSSE